MFKHRQNTLKETIISETIYQIKNFNYGYGTQLIDRRLSLQMAEKFDKSVPRLCTLKRQSRSNQYGFDFNTLRSEGRHAATNVRPGLPADLAGLRDGDYILEVNGESPENMEHDAVVKKISSNPTQVDLLVVGDYEAYLAKKRKMPIKSDTNNKQQKETVKNRMNSGELAYRKDTIETKKLQLEKEKMSDVSSIKNLIKIMTDMLALGSNLTNSSEISIYTKEIQKLQFEKEKILNEYSALKSEKEKTDKEYREKERILKENFEREKNLKIKGNIY